MYRQEKSEYTIEKYLWDIWLYVKFIGRRELTKELTVKFKNDLMESGRFADSGVNSILSSVRAFLKYLGRGDCGVKNIRIQELPFNPEEKNLTREDFDRLPAAAEGKRLLLILLVFFATGICVSELKFFTVESFRSKLDSMRVTVRCKKKNRRVLIADGLKQEILVYIRDNRPTSGPIFCIRNGKPLNRSNIWKQMKKLCEKARVPESKVFPHNLRKLFARTDPRHRAVSLRFGTQQHQYDEDLCENHRGGGPGASGACGEPNILRKKKRPHIIRIMWGTIEDKSTIGSMKQAEICHSNKFQV